MHTRQTDAEGELTKARGTIEWLETERSNLEEEVMSLSLGLDAKPSVTHAIAGC